MGRTSKVAKTHKSPSSFSSRSKKHFLRFSNRKKRKRTSTGGLHPASRWISHCRNPRLFCSPLRTSSYVLGEGKIFRKSPTGEQTDRNLCVCVPPRGSRSISSCDAFLGNSVFHCSSGWFPKRQTKKKKEIQSCCLCVLCGMSVEATGVLWW